MLVKILVVDDELPLERLITQQFRRKIRTGEWEFVFAYNGQQALDILQADTSIDLVLTDINMPELDGLTLLDQLKTVNSTLKVIVVTAYGDMANIRTAMNRGAFDFITKPIDFQDLEITIHKALDQIQQQRQQQQQLQQTQSQLTAILESTPDFVSMADAEQRVFYINPAGRDMVGLAPDEEIATAHVGDYIPAWARSLVLERGIPAAMQTGVWCGETALQHPNGAEIAVLQMIMAHRSSDGTIAFFSTIARDISERKRLERRLQQFNQELEQQVQERTVQLQQALVFEAMLKRITDRVRDSLDERQIFETVVRELATAIGVRGCNAGLYDLQQDTSAIRYEYTADAIPLLQNVLVPMELFPQVYRQLLQGHYFQFCPLEANFPGGAAAVLTCPIFDDQGVLGDLWLFNQPDFEFSPQDIRLVQQVANQCAIALRQARLYQAAQTQVNVLEHLNQMKDDFLDTVSHELRTPVSNMKMAIRMLQITLNPMIAAQTEQSAKVNQYLQVLNHQCERESVLINDLLDLQRLEAGRLVTQLESIELLNWVPGVIQPFQERARMQQQTLQVTLPTPPSLPPVVTDLPSLERILAELLNNACKYTPPEGQIQVNFAFQPGLMQLKIQNSGVEIPRDELPRIFEKFYRVPSTDPWRQGGTGLGLALVKKLTEYLGGKIWVESGAGYTSFTVEIPNHVVSASVNLC